MQKSLRVMVVDDLPQTVGFLADICESKGHGVREVTTEEEFNGFSRNDLLSFDLIILDVKIAVARTSGDRVLPAGASAGLRAARRMRSEMRISRSSLPIIVYSVVDDRQVIREFKSLECEYFVKGDDTRAFMNYFTHMLIKLLGSGAPGEEI